MVEDVVKDVGRIDVLVNNFGTSNPGKDLDFTNTDPQIFLDTVNLNLRSVLWQARQLQNTWQSRVEAVLSTFLR